MFELDQLKMSYQGKKNIPKITVSCFSAAPQAATLAAKSLRRAAPALFSPRGSDAFGPVLFTTGVVVVVGGGAHLACCPLSEAPGPNVE